ncbi:MAG: DegV family protein [Eubacteriales bacterium]|nr:DegV family protein [Eubacteriales bacterium]
MIKIFSDSTCDLSEELLKRYDITLVPLHIELGDKEYRDRIEITTDEIFAWSDANNKTPKTSACSMTDTMDAMKPVLDAGDEIVIFSISDSMSTTGNVFRLVTEELEAEEQVSVIDSANLSTGIGLLVVEAAIMAQKGKSREEIETRIEELKPKVHASFIVDTLVYLHRGGRCSSVAALAGSLLKLHPKIVVENGAMSATKKYRGTIGKVTIDYVKEMEEQLKCAKKDRVFITHSKADDIVEEVKTYLKSLNIFDEIIVTEAGGVISCHCGPGTLGVLFIDGE